ncbi:MAG TPA: exodeoxyribonuclease VII small subunit [Lentisphaeria bacterium]|nr:MAG: exodeoxyribonuclease VII small subunit [Lentisphaerae bacterium GWF2_38_69]HBM17356.1 exodeoxyribonuclease VII small subunit [Lentisphaeria bacterium]
MAEKEMSFEKALERLEAIVNTMENKKLPLDDMIKNYEEGKKLTDFCSKKLTDFEKKIEILVKETDKGPVWSEFKNN